MSQTWSDSLSPPPVSRRGGGPSPAAGALLRPGPTGHSLADLIAMLWRQIPWMAAVFIGLFLIGVVVALALPTAYQAHSSLLIRLGQSYVYQPQVGDAARGTAPDNDQVVQSELEILQSDAVKVRVIKDIGLGRLFPKLARAYNAADPRRREALEQAAMHTISASLTVAAAPDTSIARLTYSDKDPQRAALILNTLVDEYLRYRKAVLTDNLGPLDQQRQSFQRQLTDADAAYQQFMTDNAIGDFEAEKASLSQIYGQLLTDRYSVGAQAAEVRGRLGATSHQMAGSQPEIGLFRDLDHTAQDKLSQLRVDLQDLLSRYQPTAQPVKELEQRIAAEQSLAASNQSGGSGARRMGVNPVYQTLQTERNQLEAQAASLRDRNASLDKELADITARRQKLTALEPQYQQLARQRDLLSANVRNLTQREQESQAAQGLEQTGEDGSIRVVERAYPPDRGKSAKAPALAFAILFAGFAAVCIGLILSFLEKGYPSAKAAERALDLPVLVSIPGK